VFARSLAKGKPVAGIKLGELPPSTGLVAGEVVERGVLATLEARMVFEGRGDIIDITRGKCSY
jgi:hypothetical protein